MLLFVHVNVTNTHTTHTNTHTHTHTHTHTQIMDSKLEITQKDDLILSGQKLANKNMQLRGALTQKLTAKEKENKYLLVKIVNLDKQLLKFQSYANS